jgi:hypothetical protein
MQHNPLQAPQALTLVVVAAVAVAASIASAWIAYVAATRVLAVPF